MLHDFEIQEQLIQPVKQLAKQLNLSDEQKKQAQANKVALKQKMKELNKNKEPPEFMSTHPSSDNRIKDLNNKMNETI